MSSHSHQINIYLQPSLLIHKKSLPILAHQKYTSTFSHLHKIYLHPPPPTHKKRLPTSIHSIYTFAHSHLTLPTPPLHKKCSSLSTNPQKISTLLQPPKIYFTQNYPFTLANKNYLHRPSHLKFYLLYAPLLTPLTHRFKHTPP